MGKTNKEMNVSMDSISTEQKDNKKHQVKIVHKYYKYPVLSEKDFYPPSDDRIFTSGVDDMPDGDSFREYVKDFFRYYEDNYWDEYKDKKGKKNKYE